MQDVSAKEVINFSLRNIFHTSKDSLTYRKILLHEADGFTSPEGRRAAESYCP
jgi:hypothetical protein